MRNSLFILGEFKPRGAHMVLGIQLQIFVRNGDEALLGFNIK